MARQPGFDPAASHNSRQMKKSTQVALGGLSSALCLLLMFMTGLIPFSSYIFPALAGIVLISVREENGLKTAFAARAADHPGPRGCHDVYHAAWLLPACQTLD